MSEELTPMNHRELWLKAIATGTVPEWLEPMTHEELWLKAIAHGGGSGGGVLVVTETDGTLDKTWTEIRDALLAGGASVSHADGGAETVVSAVYNAGEGYVVGMSAVVGEYPPVYIADSASGYPTFVV